MHLYAETLEKKVSLSSDFKYEKCEFSEWLKLIEYQDYVIVDSINNSSHYLALLLNRNEQMIVAYYSKHIADSFQVDVMNKKSGLSYKLEYNYVLSLDCSFNSFFGLIKKNKKNSYTIGKVFIVEKLDDIQISVIIKSVSGSIMYYNLKADPQSIIR